MGQQRSNSVTIALIVVRFAHFVSAMFLFGTSAFLAFLAPHPLRASLARPLERPLILASFIAATTAVLWLLLEGGEMGDGWSDTLNLNVLGAVIRDTQFGQVWLWRLLLVAAFAIVMRWRSPRQPAAGAFLSALFLASLGLVGHAAMWRGVAGLFERANQGLHLVAAGFWLGALAPLVVCLRGLADPDSKEDAALTLRRFSGVGHVAVAVVLTTGVINTVMILRQLPIDFSSAYQASLAAKMVTVAIMVLLALYNRYVLVPRLTGPGDALAALERNTIIEMLLGGVALALVSAFATFEPV
jgi:putative copper resistance protein D